MTIACPQIVALGGDGFLDPSTRALEQFAFSLVDSSWPVFLDLIQLCITEKGRNHSVAETKLWMQEAGFTRVEHIPMTLLNTNSLLRGYRD